MKFIEIRLVEVDDGGLIYQSSHRMPYDEYIQSLMSHEQNILEDIITELGFEINIHKNGNKED